MDIFGYIIEVLACIVENCILTYAICTLFESRYHGIRERVSRVMVITIIVAETVFIEHFVVYEELSAILAIVIYILYAGVTKKGRLFDKILLIIILFLLILGINVLVTYLLSLVLGMPNTFIFTDSGVARLFAIFLTKFLFFVVAGLLVRVYKREHLELSNNELLLTICNVLLMFVTAICLIRIQILAPDAAVFILAVMMCVLVANLYVFFLIGKISRNNKNKINVALMELQLTEQKKLVDETKQMNKEVRKAGHDNKHHMLSVLGLLKMKQYDRAEHYINEVLDEYNTNMLSYVYMENSAVSSVLNYKIGRCRNENIDIKVDIESELDSFGDADICVLLANLLDNAIEASEKVSDPQISIRVADNKNYTCIEIKNKIDGSVIPKNNKLITTKNDKDNHGIGMYSIAQIVDKYDGMRDFYEKNGFFVADIWLKRGGF